MEREAVISIAQKWYHKIPFPNEYATDFEKLLAQTADLKCMSFADYERRKDEDDAGRNLVMYLYFCEELSERYKKAGISEEILLKTLEDFVISVQRNYILRGSMGVVNAAVLANHLSMRLFRIGRLQFCMTGACVDIPAKGIRVGDPVMDVHIPAGRPFSLQDCLESFRRAEEFFATYFPEYQYCYYTCFSWLLDDGLQQFLKEDSNIRQFQTLFEVVHKRKQDSILHFVFQYGIKSREELKACVPQTSFAKKVKEYALSEGDFYNVLGVRQKC